MCLTIYKSSNNKVTAHVADRDLIVNKYMRYIPSEMRLYSPYQSGNSYVFNKVYTAPNFHTTCEDSVEYGFHSYKWGCSAPSWRLILRENRKTIAVIPAGSRYFVGTNNEIVSNKIIFFKDMNSLYKYYNINCLGNPVKAKPHSK